MEGTVSVKAYLNYSTPSPEIRRFELDSDVSSSFEYLRSKVASIFPALNQQGFKVFWKDEEGDMIAVSSDEELVQALIHGRLNGIVRLFVEKVNESSPSDSGFFTGAEHPSSNVEHPGVMCDGCDCAVRGIRFKCLVCPDYDLCSTCCDKGLHNHHYMLRLATPASEWQGCGRRGPGRWNIPGFGGQGWGVPGFPMKRFWKQFMRGQAGEGGAGPNGCHPQGGAAPTAEAQPSAAGDQQKSAEEEQRKQQREYLQHMGEQVSTFLEPFGIDVDVSVEEPGIRHRGQGRGGKWRGQGQKLGGGGGGGRCNKGGKCRRDPNCKKAHSETQPDKATENPEATNQTGAETEPLSQSTQNLTLDSKPATLTADESLQSNVSGGSALAAAAAEHEMDSGEDDPSWIKIEQKPDDMEVETPQRDPQASAPEMPQTMPAFKLYPSLASQPPAQSGASSAPPAKSADDVVLDTKVAEAIAQMRSMGFHDDGGWMTAMLYENNGDVHKVIDSVLRSANRRQ